MKKKIKESDLYVWCLEQTIERYNGTLSDDKIEKLNSVDFQWEYYEDKLNKLGYMWEKNKDISIKIKANE